MNSVVMHARSGVTGDASACGLSNASRTTIDNSHAWPLRTRIAELERLINRGSLIAATADVVLR